MNPPSHVTDYDSGHSLRVLHVDDDSAFLDATASTLERSAFDIQVLTATDLEAAFASAAGVDCVVSDFDVLGLDGLGFFYALRDRYPTLPFVLFTDDVADERVRDALSAGVTDYLHADGRGQSELLALRLVSAVAHRRAERRADRPRSPLDSTRSGTATDSTPAANETPPTSRVPAARSDGGVSAATLDELKRRALDEVNLGVVISEATEDTPTLFANEGFGRLTGFDHEEFVGRNCRVLQGPETDERPITSIRKALERREPVSVVLRNYRADGTEFWNSVDISPIRNDDGVVTHFIGFQRDVTARKQLQIASEAAQRSLRQLYTVTTDSSLSLRERIQRTLAIGCQRLGVDLGFLTQIRDGEQTIVQSTGNHPLLEEGAACPLSEAYCRRTLDSEGFLSVVHAATDEGWADDPGYEKFGLECYIGAKVFLNDELFGTLCFADVEPRDEPFSGSQSTFVELLTRWVGYELERHQYERELREADRRFRSLFDNPMTFAGVLDADGTLQEANDTALATLAEGADAVVGRPFWEAPWWTPDEESVQTVREATEAAARGEVARFECDYFTAEREGTVGATLYPVYGDDQAETVLGEADGSVSLDDSTDVVSIMAVGADTTTRTEQAAQLEKQRDRLEEFASVVSHDLRSPLEVIRGRLQLYETTGDETHLETAVQSTNRMSALIDDLLELARQGESVAETQTVRLSTVAERAWAAVDTTGLTLSVTVDPETTVEADESRLQQLFENLFRNAADHALPSSDSASDSALDAPGSDEDAPTAAPLTVRLTSLADARGFAVEDDGPGIDPESRDKVFERGYTSNTAGTGFGLAIVAQIIEAHGWDVVVTASESGGARFEVSTDG